MDDYTKQLERTVAELKDRYENYVVQLEETVEHLKTKLMAEMNANATWYSDIDDSTREVLRSRLIVGCVVFAEVRRVKKGKDWVWNGHILDATPDCKGYGYVKIVRHEPNFNEAMRRINKLLALDSYKKADEIPSMDAL